MPHCCSRDARWFFAAFSQEDPPLQPHKVPEESPQKEDQLVLPDINEKRKIDKVEASGNPPPSHYSTEESPLILLCGPLPG